MPDLHARTGMDDHSGRLVDDGEVLVLVDDIERYVLGLEPCGRSLDQIDLDGVALAEPVRRLDRPVIDQHVFVLDQPLQPRTRPSVDIFS